MEEPIIQVRNLAKSYSISHEIAYRTLRDSIIDLVKKPFSVFTSKTKKEDIWALKDVAFDIQKGEAIGLIGPNGSGKSTLLKILSQITAPTEGEIHLRGRVASLLEIGTGFHPELTGRENIFLNGAILGMTRKEISSKFDEIVQFSGVEKFLDTPVKRYSSGMHVRLAFSVAAHLEPDILIVDEVLAVGDAEFQKKSLGKMNEVTKDAGRTVIFVSHNMEAIRKLCTKCILLREGKLIAYGEANDVINTYLQSGQRTSQQALGDRRDRESKGRVTMTGVHVTTTKGDTRIESGDALQMKVQYESIFTETIPSVRVVIIIVDANMQNVLWLDSEVSKKTLTDFKPHGEFACETGPVNLTPGKYFIHLNFHINGVSEDLVNMATAFEVHENLERFAFQKSPDASVTDFIIPFQYSQTPK